MLLDQHKLLDVLKNTLLDLIAVSLLGRLIHDLVKDLSRSEILTVHLIHISLLKSGLKAYCTEAYRLIVDRDGCLCTVDLCILISAACEHGNTHRCGETGCREFFP